MGMPRNPENDRHATALRLPGDLLDRLDVVARDRMLGRSKLVELLLVDALDRLEPVSLSGGTTTPSTSMEGPEG